ncbi:MAG: type II toxin-antitoxin system RelE/ParE family toxin [Sideroxydans sp.]|nr:type II toxin-antitoxin system RelE/ParE family toxin [Sideroxydans sp.]
MSYKIVILVSAEQDMKELKSYIVNKFSLATWQDTYSKLKDSIRNLKAFPFAGSIPEELERLNLTQYRQVISGMNRVIYEVRQENIYIHIVADTRKDLKTLLAQRLLRSD